MVKPLSTEGMVDNPSLLLHPTPIANSDLYIKQVNVTRVASGLDGTAGETKHSFPCPDVEPPAPIYFYRKLLCLSFCPA